MERAEIIDTISKGKKTTPVKVYLKCRTQLPFKHCHVFGSQDQIVFGDYEEIKQVLDAYQSEIEELVIEPSARNSAVGLLDIKHLDARIEPGAIVREHVTIGSKAVIMMGAVLAGVIEPPNAAPVIIEDDVLIGANAVILEGIRIKKGAVVGAGAIVTKDVEANCVVVGNPARVIKMKCEVEVDKTKIIDALR